MFYAETWAQVKLSPVLLRQPGRVVLQTYDSERESFQFNLLKINDGGTLSHKRTEMSHHLPNYGP